MAPIGPFLDHLEEGLGGGLAVYILSEEDFLQGATWLVI